MREGADSGDVPFSVISLCHTNRGRVTNGIFFQSFLVFGVLFFVCVLLSIHLFMSSFSSPFIPCPPPLLFFSYSPLPPFPKFNSVSLFVYLSVGLCSSCMQLNSLPCRCPQGLSNMVEACHHRPTWVHTPHPLIHTHRATKAAAPHNQTRPR